jgi:selenocysteine lyase/cysteine desulfurase
MVLEQTADLTRWRRETPGCQERIHLNNAGASLMPFSVLEATKGHLDLEARIGGYEAAEKQKEAIAGFYAELARLIGARRENIAFAGSATAAYAQALSSIAFERGDVILTTRDDYISNQLGFLSLQKRFGVDIVRVPNLKEGGVDLDAMVQLLDSKRPRLVAVTHVPTNSGLVQPIIEIGRACRERELLYLVDACQSLGQLPLDVEAIGCDFLSATGRKFLRGPRGTGLLFVSDRVLRGGYEPLFIDMHGATWTSPETYLPSPTAARFEDWEFPYALVLGFKEAARYASSIGVGRIAERATHLAARLRSDLREMPRVRVLDRGSPLCAIVTAAISGWEAEPFIAELAKRRVNGSISYRHFAILDFSDKNVEWALRLSPHYYNTEAELQTTVSALQEILEGPRS